MEYIDRETKEKVEVVKTNKGHTVVWKSGETATFKFAEFTRRFYKSTPEEKPKPTGPEHDCSICEHPCH